MVVYIIAVIIEDHLFALRQPKLAQLTIIDSNNLDSNKESEF